MHIKSILIALFILITLGLSAQSNTDGETFQLTKKGAHYVFTASINGTAEATILIESGIPALLVDSAYLFNSGILSDMELREATTPSGEVMGQFILTKQCQLCGITFPDAVVVITKKLPLFSTPGDIGLKFFERTQAIFDFDHSAVYMRGK